MAVEIIKETGEGLINSNCYSDLAQANTYFETRLYSENWNSANSSVQTIALIQSTRAIDNYLEHEGTKLNDSQALNYPRVNYPYIDNFEYTYPYTQSFLIFPEKELKEACHELALYMLGENVIKKDDLNGIAEIEIGPIKIKANDKKSEDQIIPAFITKILSKYAKRKGTGISNIKTFRG